MYTEKEAFVQPEMEVLFVEKEDIVTTSGDFSGGPELGGDEGEENM